MLFVLHDIKVRTFLGGKEILAVPLQMTEDKNLRLEFSSTQYCSFPFSSSGVQD